MKTANTAALIASVIILTLSWLCLSSASFASAQSPTATPLPGPVATATAAANQQAMAQAQRNQAAALAQQAAALSAQADANYSAAAQAASDARAALAAQQAGVAGEAIGRAEANITQGKTQLEELRYIPEKLSAIINEQSTTIVTLTTELQQLRMDKARIVDAYNVMAENQKTSEQSSTLLSLVGTGVAFMLVIAILAVARQAIAKRQQKRTDSSVVYEPPVIDNESEGEQ